MEDSAPGSRTYHFISGLPRSGSTLLSAILRQNPRFRAGISTPLCSLVTTAINVMGGEGRALVDEDRRRRVLAGLFASWSSAEPPSTTIFDTNREWTSNLAALKILQPDAKLICTVRDVAAIMDSIERLLRKNALLPSRMFNDAERANIYTRTEALSQRNRLVGGAWSSLREAFFGPYAESLLIVDYEHLARAPAKVLSLIYEFLGERPFTHDFEDIVYDEPLFDDQLSMPGLHKVRPRVSYETRQTALPPDLLGRFQKQNFWTRPTSSKAHLIALRSEAAEAPDPVG
jgi:sulfotransferase